jgi:hypothetical protein
MTREEHLNNLRNVIIKALSTLKDRFSVQDSLKLEQTLMICAEHGFNAGEIYGMQQFYQSEEYKELKKYEYMYKDLCK